jgi:glutamine amidotransferase-like uncharacterized protein
MSNARQIKSRIMFAFVVTILVFSMFAESSVSQSPDERPKTYIIPMEDWTRNDDVNAIRLVNMLLEEEVPVYWALDKFTVDGTTYPAGTFYIKTPFSTRLDISSDVTMDWIMWQAKLNRVWRIDVTTESITVSSKQLVLPRVVLFYDQTTYENALMHYLRFRSLGFKVVLANAVDLYPKSWNESGSVLNEANVFVMPGGAVHFWSFPWGDPLTWALGNITEFVKNGGGYVGVCAGTCEALSTVAYDSLRFVNAYMYDGVREDMYAVDWKILQGPLYIDVQQPNHPVMFGYGPGAARPGYGPETTIYYLGGPAMYDVGANATVLATYAGPVTQETMPGVSNQWGAAAVIAADYYNGKVVVFGPHPEYPGPCTRLYAQTLYYVANVPKPSRLEPESTESMNEAAISEHTGVIRSTVDQIKPILEETTRTASNIVNMRTGDIYHPFGIAVDVNLLSFSKELYSELNDLQRYAVKFQYEYSKLNVLRDMVQNDPQLVSLTNYAQTMISSFFNSTANLPPEQHVIFETHWAEIGPFPPFTQEYEASKFEELINAFKYVNNETKSILYPTVQNYSTLVREYDRLKIENQTAYTPEVNATLADLFQTLSAQYPAGAMIKTYYTLFHTLDIVQYKIAYHIFNLLTLADRTMEIISYTEFALAAAVGSWNYASSEIQAFMTHPEGAFL